MQSTPPTYIWRHRRENLKKCSLRGLEGREDLLFFSYPKDSLPELTGALLLDLDAPPLSSKDSGRPLILIDATWRYAEKMRTRLLKEQPEGLLRRSLPSTLQTAYPRRQEDCPDPAKGLASVEALYAAYRILKRNGSGLLDNYLWRDRFLKLNGFST